MALLLFLLFLFAAGLVGTAVALREAILDRPRPVPTRPELIRRDLAH